MSISRWDPWSDIVSLREAMNQLMEDGYTRPRNGSTAGMSMAVDVLETTGGFVIQMSIPGVKQDDVSISLLGNTLTIRGERKDQKLEDEGRWLIRERQSGAFQRSVTLPGPVNGEGAQADFDNGVLTVTLPKIERDKARQIQVRSAQENAIEGEAESSKKRRG